MTTHTTKLFDSEVGPRSNLWLEGQRLLDAGFLPGVQYFQTWGTDHLICTLTEPSVTGSVGVERVVKRKVNTTGKEGRPAIRIEGRGIAKLFGEKFSDVLVSFEPGVIVMRGGTPLYARSIPTGVEVAKELAS